MKREHKLYNVKITNEITGLSKNLGQDVRIEEPYWKHSLLDFWPMLFCPPHCGNTALPAEASLSFTCSILILRTQERLCMNWVRSLLSMRGMLLGYNFEPRPNSFVLVTVYSGLGYNHRFINTRKSSIKPPLLSNKPHLFNNKPPPFSEEES